SEELARALLPRIDDIHWKRMAPLIERVMDELSVPGVHIELAKVEIDLGTLPFSRFEEALEERLPSALRVALGDAVRAARESPSAEARMLPEGERWLSLLEHHLLHGTWPSWAPKDDKSSLEVLMLDRIERDPAGVTALLRRHRDRAEVLERIVL